MTAVLTVMAVTWLAAYWWPRPEPPTAATPRPPDLPDLTHEQARQLWDDLRNMNGDND